MISFPVHDVWQKWLVRANFNSKGKKWPVCAGMGSEQSIFCPETALMHTGHFGRQNCRQGSHEHLQVDRVSQMSHGPRLMMLACPLSSEDK